MNISIESMRGADVPARLFEAALNQTSLLKAVLPNDIESQRERFVRDVRQGSPRSPVFTYPETDTARVEPLRQIVDAYGAHDEPLIRLIADEASKHLARFQACVSHEADRMTQALADENGVPDEELLAEALEILRERKERTPPEEERIFSAADVLKAVEKTLAAEGLTDWKPQIHPEMAARMSVRSGNRSVNIRADLRLGENELVGLVTHEIGTHVFRWENARRVADVLCVRLSGATATEEGLAVWNEQRATGGKSLDPRFALRVVAVHTALRGSFVDVVHALLPFVPVEAAFDVATRVKRGLVDTAEPGGFVKDHVYLAGYRMVREHLDRNPDEHDLLMAGKWPLNRLSLLRDADVVSELGDDIRRPDERFIERTRDLVRHISMAR
ncbi:MULTISPECIES: tyrosine/phenylalanine carboxypeptidase domain-containing protein [unclassified Streptomyces]|uniref:tyrosine/phenylalanine carboxypeptidase domain-containing protein n=1 Tax=unclassified Streptomyces TaxID=2593676 RepID=UPI003319B775